MVLPITVQHTAPIDSITEQRCTPAIQKTVVWKEQFREMKNQHVLENWGKDFPFLFFLQSGKILLC